MNTMQNDLNQLKTLPTQKKTVILLLIGFLFIASVVVGSLMSRGKTNDAASMKKDQTSTGAQTTPSTTLTLSPAETTLRVGQSTTMTIDLASVPVAATDIVLSFDPEILSVSDVKNGDVFARVIRNKVEDGKLVFSASVDPNNAENLKAGKVLTFKVTAKKASDSALLQFVQGDTITALNGENTLGVTNGAIVKVAK